MDVPNNKVDKRRIQRSRKAVLGRGQNRSVEVQVDRETGEATVTQSASFKPLFREPATKQYQPSRNSPCGCGSGKKFKHCYMKLRTKAEYETHANLVVIELDRQKLAAAKLKEYKESVMKSLAKENAGYVIPR